MPNIPIFLKNQQPANPMAARVCGLCQKTCHSAKTCKPNGSKGLRMDLPKMACFEKVFIRESFFSADCRKKIVPCEENLGGKIWQMIGSYFVCTRKRPIIIISDLAEYCIIVKNKGRHTFLRCPQRHHWRGFASGAFWYICLCCRFCWLISTCQNVCQKWQILPDCVFH